MRETWVRSLGWENPLEKGKATHFSILGLPLWLSSGKESTCNAGDLSLMPGLWRSPGEGEGYPLQYSGLENSVDCIVNGVTKSWMWLNDFHFSLSFRIDWFDILAVQGTLKSLLQHHNSKASFLQHSANSSHLYMTTGKTITLTIWTFIGKVMCFLIHCLGLS